MKSHLLACSAPLALALFGFSAAPASAQLISYGDVSGASAGADAGEAAADQGGGDQGGYSDPGGMPGQPAPRGTPAGPRLSIKPYVEAQQVVIDNFKPTHDVLTYSVLAAGADAAINGINNQGSVSLRYERRFGEGKGTRDNDLVSGAARLSDAIVPGVLTWETAGFAARTNVQGNGAAVASGTDSGDRVSQVYSLNSGPSLHTRVGNVALDAHYRAGYTKLRETGAPPAVAGQTPTDVFDHSTNHNAEIHAGTKAGDGLPVGIGAGAGWNREDISNLDQRIDDKHARADLAVPLGYDLQVVGGVGYEKVQVSNRSALVDPVTGLPQTDANGRLITDPASPRQIGYQTSGLIWDGGVVWRPGPRTSLEAHVGRRYGSMSYTGNFAYAPSANSSLNVNVYDTISGFGGMLNDALANLPTQFQAVRSPINGDLNGCVAASGAVGAGQGTCLSGALGSVRSSVFRSRGVTASFGIHSGRLQYGLAGGYDRRNFFAAQGTALAAANGVVDKNYWVAAYLNGQIDQNSGFTTQAYANWLQSGAAGAGSASAIGATAAYYRSITRHLSASVAVGANGVNRDAAPDEWSGEAMAGLRYTF